MSSKVKATGWPQLITEDGLLANTSTRKYDLGQLAMDTRGNFYRYVYAGVETLARGQGVTHVAEGVWDTSIVTNGAVVSGATTVEADTSTSAIAANLYAGYYLTQATAAGKGGFYRIKGHDAVVTAADSFTIFMEDPVDEAIADGAALRIFHPYNVELIDADTEQCRGIVVNGITATYYGWIQVGGFVPKIAVGHTTSAAIVINEPLVPVSAVPGAFQGMAGNAEGDIMEAACNKIIALRAVAANTPGYTAGYILGIM